MKCRNERRPKLPRNFWRIKPFDRIHRGKKGYDRHRLKRELFRDLERWEW